MRNIKKAIKVRTVECIVYNRETKHEETVIAEVPEFMETAAPDNCVLLEQRTISERETVYTMTPETFFANATPEAPEMSATAE